MKTLLFAVGALVFCTTARAFSAGRILETNVVIETFAGSGFAGNVDGVGMQTMFNHPISLDIDEQGTVFVIDSGGLLSSGLSGGNLAIRQITPARAVTTTVSLTIPLFRTASPIFDLLDFSLFDKVRVFQGSTFFSRMATKSFN